jgi:hypothetical protein
VTCLINHFSDFNLVPQLETLPFIKGRGCCVSLPLLAWMEKMWYHIYFFPAAILCGKLQAQRVNDLVIIL